MQRNPYARYKQMEVTTTDPLKLVVMLYDGAITALRRAIEHIENKDYMSKYKELMRCHDIIWELMASLDKERGGEVASNLSSLYTFMLTKIMEANNTLDVKTLEDVIVLLNNLNDAWRELARRKGVSDGSKPTGTVIGLSKEKQV